MSDTNLQQQIDELDEQIESLRVKRDELDEKVHKLRRIQRQEYMHKLNEMRGHYYRVKHGDYNTWNYVYVTKVTDDYSDHVCQIYGYWIDDSEGWNEEEHRYDFEMGRKEYDTDKWLVETITKDEYEQYANDCFKAQYERYIKETQKDKSSDDRLIQENGEVDF